MGIRTIFNPMGGNMLLSNSSYFLGSPTYGFIYKDTNNTLHYRMPGSDSSFLNSCSGNISNVVGVYHVPNTESFIYCTAGGLLYVISGGSDNNVTITELSQINSQLSSNNEKPNNIIGCNNCYTITTTKGNSYVFSTEGVIQGYSGIIHESIHGTYYSNMTSNDTVYAYDINADKIYHRAYNNTTLTELSSNQLYCIKPKSINIDWVRPNLTSNGTLGGESFAVDLLIPNGYGRRQDIYGLFNENKNYFGITISKTNYSNFYMNLILYFPVPTNISYLSYSSADYTPPAQRSFRINTIEGSQDYQTFDTISMTNSGETYTLNNNDYYHYYKLNFSLSVGYWSGSVTTCTVGLKDMYITAQQIIII